jgi:hypothetical protein
MSWYCTEACVCALDFYAVILITTPNLRPSYGHEEKKCGEVEGFCLLGEQLSIMLYGV